MSDANADRGVVFGWRIAPSWWPFCETAPIDLPAAQGGDDQSGGAQEKRSIDPSPGRYDASIEIEYGIAGFGSCAAWLTRPQCASGRTLLYTEFHLYSRSEPGTINRVGDRQFQQRI